MTNIFPLLIRARPVAVLVAPITVRDVALKTWQSSLMNLVTISIPTQKKISPKVSKVNLEPGLSVIQIKFSFFRLQRIEQVDE